MITVRAAGLLLVVCALTAALGGCGTDAPTPATPVDAPSAAASATTSASGAAMDLSVIGCATDDPDDVGELTGAWAGSEGGVYYIRQVGDCVWWFGTELPDIERGVTGQRGFANVASGRLSGTLLDLEWVDLPMGNILGGGGLTYTYDTEADQLVLMEQRGDWEDFGGKILTRIQPDPGPGATPSSPASS
jgi:hypothetical protein